MIRREVAALLAYVARLDPRSAPVGEQAAADLLDQWADLLSDVPATAPHPDGRDWDAAQVVRRHIATSPYPIKPSDVSRPWWTFKTDVLGKHTDPVPAADPDDPAAWRAELRGTRAAVASGQATATVYRELTGGPAAHVAERLAGVGRKGSGDDGEKETGPSAAASPRPTRTGPLTVPCPICRAPLGRHCRSAGRIRTAPHGARRRAANEAHGLPVQTADEIAARRAASAAALAQLGEEERAQLDAMRLESTQP